MNGQWGSYKGERCLDLSKCLPIVSPCVPRGRLQMPWLSRQQKHKYGACRYAQIIAGLHKVPCLIRTMLLLWSCLTVFNLQLPALEIKHEGALQQDEGLYFVCHMRIRYVLATLNSLGSCMFSPNITTKIRTQKHDGRNVSRPIAQCNHNRTCNRVKHIHGVQRTFLKKCLGRWLWDGLKTV